MSSGCKKGPRPQIMEKWSMYLYLTNFFQVQSTVQAKLWKKFQVQAFSTFLRSGTSYFLVFWCQFSTKISVKNHSFLCKKFKKESFFIEVYLSFDLARNRAILLQNFMSCSTNLYLVVPDWFLRYKSTYRYKSTRYKYKYSLQ